MVSLDDPTAQFAVDSFKVKTTSLAEESPVSSQKKGFGVSNDGRIPLSRPVLQEQLASFGKRGLIIVFGKNSFI